MLLGTQKSAACIRATGSFDTGTGFQLTSCEANWKPAALPYGWFGPPGPGMVGGRLAGETAPSGRDSASAEEPAGGAVDGRASGFASASRIGTARGAGGGVIFAASGGAGATFSAEAAGITTPPCPLQVLQPP